MDTKEAANKLPLPVKEIVRHMRKSLKTEKPRPRRLSEIYPKHSQRYPALSSTSRCALTPSGLSSTQTFFPSSCTPAGSVNTFKKVTTAKTMDTFLHSPGLSTHYAASSPSSIYDQERSGLPKFCGNLKYSSTSMDSVMSDEICSLDDNLENGSLATLLTSDVLNTLQQTTAFNSTNELSWTGKSESDISAANGCLNPNPTLTQLNMEPDISFVNDIMNIDQNDSKVNYSNLHFFSTDISNNSGFNCITDNQTPGFVSGSASAVKHLQTVSSSNSADCVQKNLVETSNTFFQNSATMRHNFPPRSSQPQIGVAAVIKSELESEVFPKKENDQRGKLKLQTPSLHRLLNTKPQEPELKSEVFSPTDANPGMKDISAQIVPSSGAMKRAHNDFIKSEPISPKCISKHLIKEESMEDKWKDVESFMRSPETESSPKKRRRFDSGSSGHISEDDDDDDSSSYGDKYESDDDYSDIDADLAHIKPGECESLVAVGKKQKQFFWQYNVQSKGPKGTRLKLAVDSPSDPHVLNDFEDPVFDECNTAIAGIRHGGKARKGDGNEISPNPKKLFMIGHQLLRLNQKINACQLGTDVPLVKRNESRKEKNKLASRACRLKKKAQHEANKIKLYGLEQEHSQLNSVLHFIWPHIREKAKVLTGQIDKLSSFSSTSSTLTSLLEAQISQNLKSMIAGHTVEYVNSIILKVESGDYCGGLNIKRSHKT